MTEIKRSCISVCCKNLKILFQMFGWSKEGILTRLIRQSFFELSYKGNARCHNSKAIIWDALLIFRMITL